MKTIHITRGAVVGIFIFLSVAIFVLAVFTIGGQQKAFAKSISVKAIFHDIEGLQEGNNVWLYGVKIGTIKKIGFYGKDQVEITMNIIKSAQPHIPADAKAKIGTDGLIGNKIIIIYGGTMQETVTDNSYLQSETTISSDDILETLQANNKNLLSITNDLSVVSKSIRDGEGTIGKLIKDPSVADDLNSTIKNFEVVSANSEKTIARLNTYVAGLNKNGTLANELVTDTVVFSNLIKTVDQLRGAAYNIAGMTANFRIASESFTKDNTPVGVLLNNTEVASQLKIVTANLTTSSQKLNDDLDAVQHNFLFRGYFRRLAKQKKKEQTAATKDSLQNSIIPSSSQ